MAPGFLLTVGTSALGFGVRYEKGRPRLLDRNAKNAWREDLTQSFDKAQAVFLARYSGMTVEDLTVLRRDLRTHNAKFEVVKNTIAKKANEGRAEAAIGDMLKGQTGVVFAFGDVAAAAKTLSEAAKKYEKLNLVGGFMENATLYAKAVDKLASLPSREVLLSKIVGSLIAPHRSMLGVLQGVPRAMVSVLNQIKEKTN